MYPLQTEGGGPAGWQGHSALGWIAEQIAVSPLQVGLQIPAVPVHQLGTRLAKERAGLLIERAYPEHEADMPNSGLAAARHRRDEQTTGMAAAGWCGQGSSRRVPG
jgi:hypothetical protein